MPTMLARTAASSVRGYTSLSRQTTAVTATAPTTSRMPRSRPTSLGVRGLRSDAAAEGSGMASGPIEDKPREHRGQQPHARVHEQQGTKVGLEPQDDEELADNGGEDKAHGHADDPGREEGSLDVEDGVAPGRDEAPDRAHRNPRGPEAPD